VLFLGCWLLVRLAHGPVGGDASLYARMAAHPTEFAGGHWGYRLLTPWLVHILPVPQNAAFLLVTIAGLEGTAVLLGVLCLYLGLGWWGATAGAVLLLSSLGSTFDTMDFRLIDPLAYLGTMAFLVCLSRRWNVAAALSITLTMLDKEWALFLIPLFLVSIFYQGGKRDARSVTLVVLGAILPVAVFWLMRHWPGFGAGQYQDSPVQAFQRFARGQSGTLIGPLTMSFGAMWLIAPFGWRRSDASLRLSTLLLPFVLLQWSDAGRLDADRARMLAYAFPVVIPFFLVAIQPLPRWKWLLVTTAVWLTLFPPVPHMSWSPPWVLTPGHIILSMGMGIYLSLLVAPLWTRRGRSESPRVAIE
jgi:hypothetical protein